MHKGVNTKNNMRVSFFHRRQYGAQTSVERVFRDVRRALPSYICSKVVVSRFVSRGFWRRVWNVFEAPLHQGDVNHITGDVHYLALFLRRKKTLLTILDCVSLEQLTGLYRGVVYLFWFWLPVRRAGLISVISKSTKEQLLRYVNCRPEKIHVVHCPCSEEFQSAPATFNAQRPRVLQVGTGPNKNLDRLIEALREIPCHLRIVGRLSAEQTEKLLACGIDYSSITGITNTQMVKEYQQCDVLVFVSTYEGFGLPIVEAQATGRPVVTSNILSMPEVAGDAACLVDPYSVESIHKAVWHIINDADDRKRLIERGYENVKRFQPKLIAEEYVMLYRELINAS